MENQSQEKKLLRGPVFEAGPGWGSKLNNWLGRYFVKVILPVIVAVLIIYGFLIRDRNSNPEPTVSPSMSINNNNIITQIVQRGDSNTLVARRALSEYLKELSNESLTPGQKVFIEEELRKTISPAKFEIGGTITFEISIIDSLIRRSKNLTRSQLDKWESYARKVRF